MTKPVYRDGMVENKQIMASGLTIYNRASYILV